VQAICGLMRNWTYPRYSLFVFSFLYFVILGVMKYISQLMGLLIQNIRPFSIHTKNINKNNIFEQNKLVKMVQKLHWLFKFYPTMSLYRVKKKSVTKIAGKKLASYTTYLSNILSLKLAINCHKILVGFHCIMPYNTTSLYGIMQWKPTSILWQFIANFSDNMLDKYVV
jgi:hypothetical protein